MPLIDLALAASLLVAVLASARTSVTSGRERRSIDVPLGDEYRALDPVNPTDKGLIQEFGHR